MCVKIEVISLNMGLPSPLQEWSGTHDTAHGHPAESDSIRQEYWEIGYTPAAVSPVTNHARPELVVQVQATLRRCHLRAGLEHRAQHLMPIYISNNARYSTVEASMHTQLQNL